MSRFARAGLLVALALLPACTEMPIPEAREPLTYRLSRGANSYALAISGTIRGRSVGVDASLPRRCSDVEVDPPAWAAGLYFGGTSVAPHEVTADIREPVFVP